METLRVILNRLAFAAIAAIFTELLVLSFLWEGHGTAVLVSAKFIWWSLSAAGFIYGSLAGVLIMHKLDKNPPKVKWLESLNKHID